MRMKLYVKKLHEDAILPKRAHKEDAGIDLYTFGKHEVLPHATLMIPIGVAMEIAEGNVGLIWDKSSVGSKGIKTLCGVVDAGYRGEIKVVVHNLHDKAYTFNHGDKVAQMLIQNVELCNVEEVGELGESVRGSGGFGSTGSR